MGETPVHVGLPNLWWGRQLLSAYAGGPLIFLVGNQF